MSSIDTTVRSDTTEIYFTCTPDSEESISGEQMSSMQLSGLGAIQLKYIVLASILQIAVRDSGESISGETALMFLLCHRVRLIIFIDGRPYHNFIHPRPLNHDQANPLRDAFLYVRRDGTACGRSSTSPQHAEDKVHIDSYRQRLGQPRWKTSP
jgi:hypothetical protein